MDFMRDGTKRQDGAGAPRAAARLFLSAKRTLSGQEDLTRRWQCPLPFFGRPQAWLVDEAVVQESAWIFLVAKVGRESH
jgi:hypothetical protein